MKIIELIFVVIFAISFSSHIRAQENLNDENIFFEVEEMPEFPGGKKALQKFISDNVNYPETAKQEGTEGKVFVSFVVSKNGKVKNAKVIRSIDPLIDKEALRVINSMPEWTPGKQRGKKVDVQFTLPINFSLGDKKQPQKN